MRSIAKAITITAGGIAVGTGLTLGIAWGVLVGILTDDPQEGMDDGIQEVA